jgi:hypothetical protein
MIISSRDLAPANLENIDVCIVGAGAAGITLACELDGCGLKVTLLEAGGFKPEYDSLDFYRGTAVQPHPDPTEYRRSAFGGTTKLWGGRCVALEPIDFERRAYVSHSGWPLAFAEVAQYYPRALAYCDAGKFDFTVAGSLANPPPTIDGFNGNGLVLTDGIERYSLPTDFGRRYRERIARSPDVTAVLHARCVRLHKRSGDDAIESVEIVDRAGQRRRLTPRTVVLACGGIEVPGRAGVRQSERFARSLLHMSLRDHQRTAIRKRRPGHFQLRKDNRRSLLSQAAAVFRECATTA